MTDFKPKTTRQIRKTPANYQTTGIPGYDGNPLIEALPPIMDVIQCTKTLFRVPRFFNVKMRKAPAHMRYHSIQNSSKFFTPLDIHLDLERRISCALRGGYLDRNFLKFTYWNEVASKINSLTEYQPNPDDEMDDYNSTAAYGFSILGISGIGKSQIIQLILQNYPQIIFHSNYNGNLITETQLVWLKLDCPFNGSLKALCINFFQKVDAILGSNYCQKYLKDTRISAEMMIPDIANTALNHHLGVLVIDEIQRISYSKSGGKEAMLDFFVQLVNDIGIPVILSGTYKALEVLTKSLSQMRRGTGQGDVIWDRMEFDEQWDFFVKTMFNYSLTQRQPTYKQLEKLSQVLYDETQGITDLVIKAFMFSQERAIESGDEEITPSIIKSVVKDKFQLLRPILKAFKEKDKETLRKFDDSYPVFIDELMAKGDLTPEKISTLVKIEGAVSEEPELKMLIDQAEKKKAQTRLIKTKKAVSEDSENPPTKKRKRNSIKKKEDPKGEILSIVNSPDDTGENAYDLLKNNGLILSTEAFTSDVSEQGGLI